MDKRTIWAGLAVLGCGVNAVLYGKIQCWLVSILFIFLAAFVALVEAYMMGWHAGWQKNVDTLRRLLRKLEGEERPLSHPSGASSPYEGEPRRGTGERPLSHPSGDSLAHRRGDTISGHCCARQSCRFLDSSLALSATGGASGLSPYEGEPRRGTGPAGQCPKCGGTSWQVLAGHYVCATCGAVWKKEEQDGERHQETETR